MHIYLKEIKREFPQIKPFENDDLDWHKQATGFLKEEDYDEAEAILKKLCLSQPDHYDGLEGLAYVYYIKGEFEKAAWFMQEAIKRATKFLDYDAIDPNVIEEMKDNFQGMVDGKQLETAFGTIEPLAEGVLFAEDEELWYEQFYRAPFKLRYRMLMETLEHSLPFAVLEKEEADFKEDIAEQDRLQELFFNYVELLLDNKEMDKLRQLLVKFRAAQPELYRRDYNHYDRYLVQIALFRGEKEKVADYLDNFIQDPVSGIDELIVVLQLLQFYGSEQAEFLSRKVCTVIRDDKKLIPGGEVYFEDTIFLALMERVYNRLQQGNQPALEEINKELDEFGFYLKEDAYAGMIFQLAPGDDRQKVEDLLQFKTGSVNSILNLLSWHFCKYLLERKGLSFIIGGTLFHWLKKTFNYEEQGKSENSGDFEYARDFADAGDSGDLEDRGDTEETETAAQGLPSDCFVFQKDIFDRWLHRLDGFLSNQWPQVAGLLWGAPYFYEFLYEHGAITADELEHTRNELNEMQQQFMQRYASKLWRYNFVHSWPPPDGVSEEAWAEEKEQFARSFTEVSEWVKERMAALASRAGSKEQAPPPRRPLSDNEILDEEERQEAAEKKRRTKQKNKRKEAKKQRRKQRK